MRYQPNTRGDLQDRVRLVLGSDEVLIAEGYEVHQGVLTQPSAFSLRLGYGGIVASLAAKYGPRTKFRLYIGEALRFTGYTDGWILAGEAGATEITIQGRDMLAALHDAYIRADKTYTDRTYFDLVTSVLRDALGPMGFEPTLFAGNGANRLTLAGLNGLGGAGAQSGVAEPRQPIIAITAQEGVGKALTQIVAAQNAPAPSAPAAPTPTKTQGAMLAKAGERFYEFLKKELDRAGLCLWATADGEAFVLAAPDGNQAPIGRLVRKRGTSGNVVNVLSARYTNDSSKRFSEVVVYARGGGKKAGRTKATSAYEDAEVKGWGIVRPLVLRDHKCQNEKQCEYLARRKMAESRRAGFNLTYSVAGHTFPAIGTGERAVWTPDTVVDVDDDEFDLHGLFYVEQVAFRRSPQTTTDLTLLRPSDLIFAEDPPT